jgi:hypothetical protein
MCLLAVDSGGPDSVYRNYAFVCFLLPIVLCLIWQTAFKAFLPAGAAAKNFTGLFAAVAAGFSLVAALGRCNEGRLPEYPSRWPDFLAFAGGGISVRDALIRGDGLWPVADAVRRVIGPEPRVFTFAFPRGYASCLFPGSGMSTEPITSFGRNWHEIAFGDAAGAETALKSHQFNYFLMDFSLAFRGALAYAPIFDPDHLAERFDVVWAGGPACLLTWKGAGRGPVTPDIVNAWRQRVVVYRREPDPNPDGVMGRIYDNMKVIYDYNKGRLYPVVRPPDLPRVTGWQ